MSLKSDDINLNTSPTIYVSSSLVGQPKSSSSSSQGRIGKSSNFIDLSKTKNWVSSLSLSDKEIKWIDENENQITIKISELAKKLGISKSHILRYFKSGEMEKLKDLKRLADAFKLSFSELVEAHKNIIQNSKADGEEVFDKYVASQLAAKFGISESAVLKYIKGKDIKKIQDLQVLANTLNVPFPELFQRHEAGTQEFANYLEEVAAAQQKWNDEVDALCKKAFDNLDSLFADICETLMVKQADGSFKRLMPATNESKELRLKKLHAEFEAIKRIIKIQYRAFGKNPPMSEQIISISDKYRIIIKPSGDSITITSLFGTVLGQGSLGVVFHAIDLLAGTLATGEEAVLKESISMMGSDGPDVAGEQIVREYTSLKKIHGDGKVKVLGIQNPVRLITDLRNGEVSYSHLGPLYETDMQKKQKQGTLSLEDQFSLTYQLLHGISHMHKKSITNGDIKPANIFCKGPLLYLSDFGGSIDHSAENSLQLETMGTEQYRLLEDTEAANAARKAGDKELYMKIEKKADVFAACSVICSFFINEQPYDGVPGQGGSVIKPGLKEKLMEKGLSERSAKLLIEGLSKDHNERPNAEDLFNAIKSDMQGKVSSERMAFLEERSLPL